MRLRFMLICAAVVGLSPAAYAQHSEEQARLCTGDAMRLCGMHIPDVERITTCMREQKANLSTPCRMVFDASSGVQPASSRSRN